MDLKATNVNQTRISGVVRYDDLRNILADLISKTSRIHRTNIYEGLSVEYEGGAEGRFGRLLIDVVVDHNAVKEG